MLFLVVHADDFKLAGVAGNTQESRNLILNSSEAAPNGIEMDPPAPEGRCLRCEHRLSERQIDWQGGDLTASGPPPPKTKKPKNAAAADA
eukprot:7469934-Pyramimonas_sp.AAC.1